MFELLPAFQNKVFVIDLSLSKVLLNDSQIPWIFLIPMREGISQINQLSSQDSEQLMREITFCSNTMENLFKSNRINVAAIGNKTPQLHVHIISRQKTDEAWPETVWGLELKKLPVEEQKDRAKVIRAVLKTFLSI